MLADQDSNTNAVTIYVKLLNEGTNVFRPTSALVRDQNAYLILGDDKYDPEDEIWEFTPGSLVYVATRHDQTGEYLVAVAHAIALPL